MAKKAKKVVEPVVEATPVPAASETPKVVRPQRVYPKVEALVTLVPGVTGKGSNQKLMISKVADAILAGAKTAGEIAKHIGTQGRRAIRRSDRAGALSYKN